MHAILFNFENEFETNPKNRCVANMMTIFLVFLRYLDASPGWSFVLHDSFTGINYHGSFLPLDKCLYGGTYA